MFDLDKITEILQTITKNKTRSLLTAFGVFWGIFMLVVLIGGGNGLDYLLKKQIGGLATNSGFIWTNTTSEPYMGFRKGRWWNMKTQDVEILRQQMPEIEYIAGVNMRWDGTVIRGERTKEARLRGITPVYAKIHQPIVMMGRFINDIDVLEKRKVCVIGQRIYETLFLNGEDPIGQTIYWNGVALTVIGVYKPVSNIQINGDDNEMVVLPLSTMQLITNAGDRLDMIAFTAKPGYRISDLEEKASQILKRQHRIAPHDKKAVYVMNIEKEFLMFSNLFLGINILVWIVGLGTLIAGVIGVSNIMMV
jgi:putative ABC transport system permease protein